MSLDHDASAADGLRIRQATEADLLFVTASPDPQRMEEIKALEIVSARTATVTPRHWSPTEIDATKMR